MNKINKIKMPMWVQRNAFAIKSKSPEIFMSVGIAGIGFSLYLTAKGTVKYMDAKQDFVDLKKDIEETRKENPEHCETEEGSEILDRAWNANYVEFITSTIKSYAPAVLVAGLSITLIIQSHNILKARNIALGAAFAGANETLKRYRNNVTEKYGEDVDLEMMHGSTKEKVTVEKEVDGKIKKVKEEINISENSSEYEFIFGPDNVNWDANATYRETFLRSQESFANYTLVGRTSKRKKGFIFLNEVLNMIDIPMTKAGQVVGWVYDPEENSDGDNYVNFRIYETMVKTDWTAETYPKNRKTKFQVINNKVYETVVKLDFNVDGNIWELMDRKGDIQDGR